MKKTLTWVTALMLIIMMLPLAFAQPIHTIHNSPEQSVGAEKLVPVQSSVLSDELQAMENNANEKYNKLLVTWAYDPNFPDDVNANFPSFYGGAYINKEKKLVIQVTTLNEAVTAYFGNLIDLTDVIFEEVMYSYNRLKQEHSIIASQMNSASGDSFTSNIDAVGISIPDNAVNLYLVSNAKTANLHEEIQNKLSAFDKINIIIVPEKDTSFNTTTIYPGSAIKNTLLNNVTYTRSIGFWARDKDGNLGIVTAPHDTLPEGNIVYVGNSRFGVASTPHYGGNLDAIFIKCTDPFSQPSRLVTGTGFSLYAGAYMSPAVGTTVYTNGIVSKFQSGTIVDVNYKTDYGPENCVLTDVPGDRGDSGGPVACGGTSTNRFLAGIITGGNNGKVIYVKAGYIMPELSLEVW